MDLTSQIKLLPTPEQSDALRRTMERSNAACNFISAIAWRFQCFHQFDLHHRCYYRVRAEFGLSAQMTVHCIAKVTDSYRSERRHKHRFKPQGSIAYDDRILSWRLTENEISIGTVLGRMRIPFICGGPQHALLQSLRGEARLVCFHGTFFLAATCEVAEPMAMVVTDTLGIDLGIRNIAVDSDGKVHSSSHLNNLRHRYRRLRQKLQSKGTKSARRRLKQLSGRESRFARNLNHYISKQIVSKAQGTCRQIALENLQGIVEQVTVRRRQRDTLRNWSFFQLRNFITYKARRVGVPVQLVDPRNTSRKCPRCGCVDKRNRPSQSVFSCVICGFAGLADHVAAENIRRAAVNPPYVSRPIEASLGVAGTNHV